MHDAPAAVSWLSLTGPRTLHLVVSLPCDHNIGVSCRICRCLPQYLSQHELGVCDDE